MSDKKQALVIWLRRQIEFQSPFLDFVVQHGNSQLLVLRQSPASDIGSDFKSLTSLSQLDDTDNLRKKLADYDLKQGFSRIEKKFFKKDASADFSSLFHRPLKARVVTFGEIIPEITQICSRFGIEESSSLQEPSDAHLTIAFVDSEAHLKELESTFSLEKHIVYLIQSEVSITKEDILPKTKGLPFDTPNPSYLQFGPIQLDFDTDISQSRAMIVTECDVNFCKIDGHSCLQSTRDLRSFGCNYQLADTFMRSIAFKLGKLDKFGA